MIERKGKLDDRSDSDRNLSEKILLEKGEGEGGKKDGNDKNEKELFGTRNDDDTDKRKYFSIVGRWLVQIRVQLVSSSVLESLESPFKGLIYIEEFRTRYAEASIFEAPPFKMHYARRQPMKEAAANGAREDKYMACMRFRRGRGKKEGRKRRAGKRGGGEDTGRRDVLDDEGTQRRKLNGEGRERG